MARGKKGAQKATDPRARQAAPSPAREQTIPENTTAAQTGQVGREDHHPEVRRNKRSKAPKPGVAPEVYKSRNLVWGAGDASTKSTSGNKRKREGSGDGSNGPDVVQEAESSVAQPLFTPATEYLPIVESNLVPPHLRHPFRSYPLTTTFDISQAINSEPVTEKGPTENYLKLAAGVPNAYWKSDVDSNGKRDSQRRKLLVLDLNGALVVRSARTEAYVPLTQRKVFARPFLNCFLDYLLSSFGPKKTKKTATEPQRMRPYEVFIWSSAQPKSIEEMISAAFLGWGRSVRSNPMIREQMADQIRNAPVPEKRIGRVLGVWSRAEMGLTSEQYFAKSATLKDLDKLYRHFQRGDTTITPNPRFYHPDPMFRPDPTNTLLIDDSTDKASLQPYNHLPILDFDLKMLQNAADAVDADNEQYGLRKTMKPIDVLRLVFGASASDFYHRHVAHDVAPPEDSAEKRVDGILLAIVGILSELADVESVPAWIAAGGLQPDIAHTFTEEIAARGWEHIVAADAIQHPLTPQQQVEGKKPKRRRMQDDAAGQQSVSVEPATGGGKIPPAVPHPASTSSDTPVDPANHVIPQTLPSHPDYQHWYNSPVHVLYWVRRGIVALAERGVTLQHNMSGVGERLKAAEREQQLLDERAKVGGQGIPEKPARYFQAPVA